MMPQQEAIRCNSKETVDIRAGNGLSLSRVVIGNSRIRADRLYAIQRVPFHSSTLDQVRINLWRLSGNSCSCFALQCLTYFLG